MDALLRIQFHSFVLVVETRGETGPRVSVKAKVSIITPLPPIPPLVADRNPRTYANERFSRSHETGKGWDERSCSRSDDPLDPAFHYSRVSQCVLLEFYYVYNGDRENTIDQKDKKDFRAEVFANKDSSRADPFITNRSSSA